MALFPLRLGLAACLQALGCVVLHFGDLLANPEQGMAHPQQALPHPQLALPHWSAWQ